MIISNNQEFCTEDQIIKTIHAGSILWYSYGWTIGNKSNRRQAMLEKT